MRTLMMIALFLLPANFLAAGEEKVDPDFYFEYTQDNGTRAFTDALSKVPPKFKAAAKQMSWVVLEGKTRSKTTISQFRGSTISPRFVAPDLRENARAEDECNKVPTFDHVYKQVGDITRVYYRIFDECGKMVGEFPFQPPYSYLEPHHGPRPSR